MTARQLRVVAAVWSVIVVALLWMPLPASEGPKLHLDKVAHAGAFGLIGALWHAALGIRLRATMILLAGVAFAAMTELVQGLLPWSRTPETADLLADAAGLCVGVLVVRRLRRNGRDSNPR